MMRGKQLEIGKQFLMKILRKALLINTIGFNIFWNK